MDARKRVAIFDEPNTLVIHLKRFNSSPFSFSGTGKVGRHVVFGPELHLGPFSTRSLQMEDGDPMTISSP